MDSSSVYHQQFFTVHTAMVYVIQLASRIRTEPAVSNPVWNTIAVCTVKNSWWWIEELSETCRVLFQKQIWEISASSWFYYKNLSRCTVTWTSKTWTNYSYIRSVTVNPNSWRNCAGGCELVVRQRSAREVNSERERENVGENIPDFVGCGHCLL